MEPRRFCVCEHSDGAHLDGGEGRCGLCHCQQFRLNPAPGAQPSILSWAEERLTLAEAAHRLNCAEGTLRKYAQDGRFPGKKTAGRWTFALRDVADCERQLREAPKSIKARARLAAVLAFRDEMNTLRRSGLAVSEPLRPGAAVPDRAQQAASTAIDHQINPGVIDGGPPLAPGRSKRRKAQLAEREALESILRKPGAPHPPERSL